MENLISITPVTGWYNGSNKTMSKIRFERLTGYHFDNNGARVNYALLDDDEETITGGGIAIPAEVFNAWTTDDNIIFNYVLEQLNLNRA